MGEAAAGKSKGKKKVGGKTKKTETVRAGGLERNANHVAQERIEETKAGGVDARSMEAAIEGLHIAAGGDGVSLDRHPERRQKAAFSAYEEREMAAMREDKCGLKRSQVHINASLAFLPLPFLLPMHPALSRLPNASPFLGAASSSSAFYLPPHTHSYLLFPCSLVLSGVSGVSGVSFLPCSFSFSARSLPIPSQMKQLVFKQWQKSPENPMNQEALAYNHKG